MSTKKVPPPSADATLRWASHSSSAKAEEKNWDNEGILRGQEEKNQLLILKAYGWIVCIFLLVFALLFLGSLGSWAAHYMLPESYHWLKEPQLSKIQSVLFSGSIGGVVSLIAQRHFLK